ncbi:lysylphosphatidylglycerol synthase transmembrane domain-containing protein [Guptibacillus hwajinpoensis]|uniref:lysylphosphatidylglycerol synthase transmembrane domain-containing protein n=1 Tax=Guptibacillus hwajinpoensis TaxID=208199 RepID=UPI001CD1E39F|nr:lysylphosphatidylglycerol synthase transmembrane domain-containing protein [Pseudalkalibacillus hwajinpoensis]MCA0992499.1 flippase-like domain-containing protein [Pseudalkalibacillus hwajinpoensis]
MGKKLSRVIKWVFGLLLLSLFAFLLLNEFNVTTLTTLTKELISNPGLLFVMVIGYTSSFLLRGLCWRLLVDRTISMRVYLAGIFYSLFFNHLLPFKGGEAVRMGVLAHKQKGQWTASIQSVVILRAIDLFWLGVFAMIGAELFGISISTTFLLGMLTLCLVIVLILILYVRKKANAGFLYKQFAMMKKLVNSPYMVLIFLISCLSWIAEGIVVYSVAGFNHHFAYLDAMWVTALSVGSGVFQLAPGGFATYESVMSFSLHQVGIGWEEAFSIALVTHAFKYAYSFVSGLVAFYLYPLRFQELRSFMKKKGETS